MGGGAGWLVDELESHTSGLVLNLLIETISAGILKKKLYRNLWLHFFFLQTTSGDAADCSHQIRRGRT